MKIGVQITAVVAIVGAALLAWFWPDGQEEAGARPDTEVAVHVGKIARATLHAYVQAFGVVEPMPGGAGPAASSRVAPSVSGVVVEVNCVEGQHVAKDDLLFQLDRRAADVAMEFATRNLARQKQLMEVEGTSERVLQEAQQQFDAARVQQALLSVRSPLTGTVTRVNVRVGEAVDLMTVLAEVVDLDRLVVSASVPDVELATLRPGQFTEILLGGETAPAIGELSFVSPQVDLQTGSGLVRVALPEGSPVRPGQFVTIRIITTEHADRLAVPLESIVKDDNGMAVISIVEGNRAKRMRVATGLVDRGLVEIEGDGLRENLTIVTQGTYGLPDETRIRIVEK